MSKGGGTQTVTNVQSLPPEIAGAVQAAYSKYNPFESAFGAVADFNPVATKQGTAGLSAGEDFAIQAANSALRTRPAFLGTAQQNLGSLMDGAVDTTALQDQLGMTADTSLLEGIAGGSTNPLLQQQIDDAIGGAVDSISSQYARGGRLGSGSFADSLGAGITSAAAPILAQNLQRDRANQLAAAQSLLSAQQTDLGRDATLANQLTAASEADARARLAAISAAPGLLGADQALISQAAQLGALERGIDQARRDATAAQAAQQNVLDQNRINALLQSAGMGSGLFGQTTTQNQSNNASFLDQASSAATTAAALAGLFSDQRLKKNITKIGVHKNGLNIYSWDWNETARSFDDELLGSEFGFIAQEAQQVYPEHVHKHSSGYLMLDYDGLGKEVQGVA
tara:strand:- start:2153 stop:3343 length:1191 start_codon:yes stop_codon:yes gene_type:complete